MIKSTVSYFIGLDIGTSSAKAVAFDAQGLALAQAARTYEIQQPTADAAEQDPEEIRIALLDCLKEVVKIVGYAPKAIGLSSAMHSLMAVDKSGQSLSPLFIWADGRAGGKAKQLKETALGKYIYLHSGTPIHAMSPLCKLAWLKEEQAGLFQQADRFVGIKEYVLFHCFGQWLIDHSLASATGLFDLKTRLWIPEALSYASVTKDQLSLPVPGTHILPNLPEDQAQSLGISSNTPWVIGASDGCLANLGAGLSNQDEAVLTIGTSGAIRLTVSKPVEDQEERIFCYILDDKHYVIGGASNNGGVVWEWFCKQFFPDQRMDQVFKEVEALSPGANGLLFLPYLHGERAPVWDANARGYFWGIEAVHTRAHFARAVLEGICLNLYQITKALEEVSGPIRLIHANGGFTQSPVWIQLLADIMGKSILVGTNHHASAWGAAMMAMQAIGHKVEKTGAAKEKSYQPNLTHHEEYSEIFANFKGIYEQVK